MTSLPKLSAIIIANNEERDLPACLESLRGLADDLVLVDSHSTDRTREIAKAAGARVFERD
jgi:glycosyltransferase involved in cell wall biosynthesis